MPTFFRPVYQKHRDAVCGGVEIAVTDRRLFRPYRCGVELLAALRRVAPRAFAWRRGAYEFVSDRPAIDLLTGDSALRRILDAGGEPREWIASWQQDEQRFREERREVLLYVDGTRDESST